MDMVTCKPILSGSGLRMAIYFLRIVLIVANLGIVIFLRKSLPSFAPLYGLEVNGGSPNVVDICDTPLIPLECFANMTLLWLSDDAKDGNNFATSVLVFEYCSIIGAPDYENYKGRAYLYRREIGSCKEHQAFKTNNGGVSNVLVNM